MSDAPAIAGVEAAYAFPVVRRRFPIGQFATGAAALVAIGSISGAQVGARYGRRIPEQTLRWTVVTVGVIVAIVLLVK